MKFKKPNVNASNCHLKHTSIFQQSPSLQLKKPKPSRCYHHPGGSQTMKELYHILCGHIATDTYHHGVGSWGPATLLEQTCPHPWGMLEDMLVPFLKMGYVSFPWRGYIHMYSFLTSQLRVWNFMEHKTIFGPIMKTFKGHMESCCLPVTCLRDSEDPKITSPKLLAIQIL